MQNFETTIKKYQIQIPIIQRDYAQGRTDPKSSRIRASFLESIYDSLKSNKPLHLDFVYGSINGKTFVPLDGQQRLTTLFLLYWYFGKKEGLEIDYLKGFTYETRASSREFCIKLVQANIDFDRTILRESIIDSSWFLIFWMQDPTIKSMLTMIDDIHLKFNDVNLYHQLENITFDFFELEKFGLDDDLYIKMNARGKALTQFESFKAIFEQHLERTDIKLLNEFSEKIDNIWTDAFWKFAIKEKTYLVDDYLLRYVYYIGEMLHFKSHTNDLAGKMDFNQLIGIFESTENIRFLFKALDSIEVISHSFEEIFSKNKHEFGKVCLWDESINLAEKLILKNSINIQQRIILFIIVTHLIEFEVNEGLKDLVRLVRNLTSRIKHLKRGEITYTSDLTFDNIHPLLNIFLRLVNTDFYANTASLEKLKTLISGSGITKESINQEMKKIKLAASNPAYKNDIFKFEDFKYVQGDLAYFDDLDIFDLSFYNEALQTIFEQSDSLIIMAMLTVDDYALKIGWTLLGDKYFFGKRGNWDVILKEANNGFLKLFFDEYKNNEKSLQAMIDSFILNKDKDWRYYFVKYENITNSDYNFSKDSNIYAWGNSDFEIEKMGGSNLNAYHLNPYLKTVAQKVDLLENTIMCQSNECSYMELGDIEIYSSKEGWLFKNCNDDFIDKNLYGIESKGSQEFILYEDESNDRIEILVKFINDYRVQLLS